MPRIAHLSELPDLPTCEYDEYMATQDPTEAEVFQRFLIEQVASTGRAKSPEELVRLWRERQLEHADAMRAVERGVEDVEAGRTHPFADVNDEIRRKHGWSNQG
jgi:hypothetical protein